MFDDLFESSHDRLFRVHSPFEFLDNPVHKIDIDAFNNVRVNGAIPGCRADNTGNTRDAFGNFTGHVRSPFWGVDRSTFPIITDITPRW